MPTSQVYFIFYFSRGAESGKDAGPKVRVSWSVLGATRASQTHSEPCGVGQEEEHREKF